MTNFYYTLFLAFATLTVTIGSCQSDQENDPLVAEGKRLAEQHCGSCHVVPAPELLDKETWLNHVLPAMAPKLGLEVYPGGLYYAEQKAAISFDNWQKLLAYYQTLAPEKLKPVDKPEPFVDNWAIFSLEKPQTDTTQTAMTTLVAVDTIGHQLYTSDALRSDLTRWTADLKPTRFRTLNSAAVDARFFRDGSGQERGLFTTLGTMQAADIAKGEVVALELAGKTAIDSAVLARELPRPLKSLPVDVNKDGRMDWVVCGFGHNAGGLYWLRQQPNHQFIKQPIKEVPGASQAITGDFNNDGWPDLMVLFAHADEGIWLFQNDKKGGFTERNLLRFPSVYGSTSFQLVDFNKDGRLDILYTCGDNSDYSKIMKPYHGLYIYLNQGNFAYKPAYFYPVNGCTKAVAADFDKDGDLDMAVIAFFADFKTNAAESFLFFEQQKPLQFRPHAVPVSTYGRWICMDVNDIDRDGDDDIVLGNFSKTFIIQEGLKPTWDKHLPFIVLKNKTR